MKRWVTFPLIVSMLAACTEAPQDLSTSAPDAGAGPSVAPAAGIGALIDATVQVDIYEKGDSGTPRFVGSGSGTILTRDGLILTNAHVAAPDAPGQAVQYGEPGPSDPVERLVIRMTEAEDRAPVESYEASVVAVDGYLDIAVLQVTATADGQALAADSLDLPFVPVGDSDLLHIGDPLTVVGFPGIGGDTVSEDTGDVSGFLDDGHIGVRGWIKTSAVVHYGNSGGLAANADGEIVGVPTRAPEATDASDVGGYQLLRPINLAMPVIDAAMAGREYGLSPHVVHGTGRETFTFRGWGDPASTSCATEDLLSGHPSGSSVLEPIFAWSGLEPGVDYLIWLVQNPDTPTQQLIRASPATWELDALGTCLAATFRDTRGFKDGTYRAIIFVGPTLRFAADGSTTIPAETTSDPNGVVLSGRIIDAGSGQPIVGALVFALLPSTDAAAWLKKPTEEVLAASAETMADGSYKLNRSLTVGSVYPLVIYASGHQTWQGSLTVRSGNPIGDIGLVQTTP